MKYINKIGVEIECGIDKPRSLKGFMQHEDSSVSCSEGEPREYVTVPMDDLKELKRMINRLYTHIVEINDTMGLHVHVSLKNNYYYTICSYQFYEHFMDCVQKSKLYARNYDLQDRVEYSDWAKKISGYREIDDALIQPDHYNSLRYRAVNFCAYRRYQTVEFRIFPAMDSPKEVMCAIRLTLNAINSYIRKHRYLNKTEVVEVEKKKVNEVTKMNYIESVKGGIVYV